MECVIRGSNHRIYSWLVEAPHDSYDIHVLVERVAAPAEHRSPAAGRAEAKSKIQNPKSKIRARVVRPGQEILFATFGFWILDSGFWILDFAFCSAGIRRRNRRRSRGSQRLIEDPRSVHSVAPGAKSQEGGEASGFCSKIFCSFWEFGQNPTPKIPESRGGRITARLEFLRILPRGLGRAKARGRILIFLKSGAEILEPQF